jgi:hypothetical protein|tara:strand:- start:44 stop:454 length:411 start_codon:yes stop_codon:yes gene_type:complete
METLETIKKTDCYKERKAYSEANPDDQRHNEFTDLIDDFIKVALHMKHIHDMNIKRERGELEFDSYVQIYGLDYENTGVMQKVGPPFVEWRNEEKTHYKLSYGRLLRDVFKAIFEDNVSYDEIVPVVEERDMWWHC